MSGNGIDQMTAAPSYTGKIEVEANSSFTIDMDEVVRAGRLFCYGVLVEIAKWFAIGMALTIAVAMIGSWLGYSWDSTDDRAAGVRSGMRLRTDHLTGCQYLESEAGSLTARLEADGRQICGARRTVTPVYSGVIIQSPMGDEPEIHALGRTA